MEALPEVIVRAMQQRSPRPPLTSRTDPDFGNVWLVWTDGDRSDPYSERGGYGDLTEWLGVIDVPGHPQATDAYRVRLSPRPMTAFGRPGRSAK